MGDLQHTQQLQHRAGFGAEATDFEVAIQGKGSPTPAPAPTISCAGWDYANARCKNHGMCEYRYQFGDWHLGNRAGAGMYPSPSPTASASGTTRRRAVPPSAHASTATRPAT